MSNWKNRKQHQKDFIINVIKGEMAETLVEFMFKEMGYQVRRTGVQRIHPEIFDRDRDSDDNSLVKPLRQMPDMIAIDEEDGKIFLFEIKYRTPHDNDKYVLKFNDQEVYPFKQAYIILVSVKGIKCISFQQWSIDKTLSIDSEHDLHKQQGFRTVKSSIEKYEKIAKELFGHFGKAN